LYIKQAIVKEDKQEKKYIYTHSPGIWVQLFLPTVHVLGALYISVARWEVMETLKGKAE
jgi:hypothetical protein